MLWKWNTSLCFSNFLYDQCSCASPSKSGPNLFLFFSQLFYDDSHPSSIQIFWSKFIMLVFDVCITNQNIGGSIFHFIWNCQPIWSVFFFCPVWIIYECEQTYCWFTSEALGNGLIFAPHENYFDETIVNHCVRASSTNSFFLNKIKSNVKIKKKSSKIATAVWTSVT